MVVTKKKHRFVIEMEVSQLKKLDRQRKKAGNMSRRQYIEYMVQGREPIERG